MNFAELITEYLGELFTMLRRRTSKRFVLGDTTSDEGKWDEEATDVMPSELLQKFQMTLQADPDSKEDDTNRIVDEQLLKLPVSTLT
ncbi:unnamed protein product [Leptidea sinapis]|uniref:Uncharacterized protein n=1 Tax=Leptidea sinapis TaxID=189913 RepID=A0A5E4QG85_9NEOP|nr:unnamed protein product [Leptidea sinapis]